VIDRIALSLEKDELIEKKEKVDWLDKELSESKDHWNKIMAEWEFYKQRTHLLEKFINHDIDNGDIKEDT
jgi:molecular chaperone GrpE (heat shock protein)